METETELSKDIFVLIAQQCDPLSRAHWMMAYPKIFKQKALRDYVRIESAKKYAKRWRENIGYWRIFWDRIPNEPIHKYTLIQELFPEFDYLRDKPFYRLLDMPLYTTLVSPIVERCYNRRNRNNIPEAERYQMLMGMICKYYIGPFIPEEPTLYSVITRIIACSQHLFADPRLTDTQVRANIIYIENLVSTISHSNFVNFKEILLNVPYNVIVETLV